MLFCFLVGRPFIAKFAKLLLVHPFGVQPFVLLGRVVSLLALRAFQRYKLSHARKSSLN